jgi:GNAT superfamily N-acetyltransferase
LAPTATESTRDLPTLAILPATPDRWDDLETLFGPRGACAGCWCMYWRQTQREFEAQKGEGNRRSFEAIVASGPPPGVIAYSGPEPIGWCAVGPRPDFSRLARSRILKPVDDEPVWSIVCLFVTRPWRRRGVSVALLRGAAEFAVASGGRIVEGYPTEPRKDRMPDAFAWTGIASAYLAAGFSEVARRSETRPIMRWSTP